ncbi:SCO family protein [Halarcobacter bivalviorum]|uniref:Cytochrome oxidase copper insertion factor, SCO1/SenC/PrrC family n=1 Tax=Halarcobacter bivalviorum TaxID=663364 RepID=A0AAX2A5J0_9BACT|nr:SCO family protein [Halarcobacter bivalviorum]AXH12855.1 cytochrome oxidase copper insertion factor, SCO1/SenC/PrrC family [Halarcobacter bivalviorum]RXK04467.1 SCO family protein [Halarcobacter bivalviorum]RXK09020.1 SCO family protein [Halarcobacter bivalviorum]
MKNFLRLGIIFVISVILISFLKPFVEQYKEKQKYDFTVETVDGKISKDDFKGKALAIYFGYTYCPDVCPTSLSSLSQALKSFSEEETKDFTGLFISVDPDRDKLASLKEYAKYFHKNFIGATSNKQNIDDITKRYDTYYEKVALNDSAMGYSVSHTSYIYLFDKEGNFVAKVDHFSDPSKIKESLLAILK